MLKIYSTRQTRYPADTKAIKARVKAILVEKGITDAEVSIALIGERKMRELAKTYMNETDEDGTHEVLSFPTVDFTNQHKGTPFINPPISNSHLGDIIICYPEARHIAMKRNRMVDDIIAELAEHATLHLLGFHHE